MEPIHIQMLGDFSLSTASARISDSDNRTRKVWLLLAYLVCNRGRSVSAKKLIELLWGEEPASANPENALRISFHRARNLLNQLWDTAGHDLILRRDGGYQWNNAIPLSLDYEEFETLCQCSGHDSDERLALLLKALSLYRGDFLDKLSSEVWIIPTATHFHNLYISAVMEAAALLSERHRHGEAAELCRKAAASDPYQEPLHQILIRELAASGNTNGASQVYMELSRRLFDDFGIHPSEETRAAYREAVHSPRDRVLPMDEVLEHLQEQDPVTGAMRCDYDYFKMLCRAESRSLERSGNVAHLLLLSVSSGSDIPLSRRTLNRIMDQLGEQIHRNLRRSDIYSRCSVSQYIILLPEANYENSCMVSRRILGAFSRKHPHVSAKIHFMVQPLNPFVRVP